MSHLTKIDLEITDLDALKAAVKRLHPDLEFREGQKTFRWYGRFVGDSPVPDGMKVEDYGKCEHAIGLAGNAAAYEVGLVRLPGHKGYRLVYDNWAGGYGMEKVIGKDAAALRQGYAREVATRTMRRQGYRVREETQADGTIRLHCSKPNTVGGGR